MQSNTEAFYQEQLKRVTNEFEDFVYIVSHDLKAPIRAINNLSVWIEEDLGDNIPEDVKDNLRLLRDRTERMEKMMNAILQLSRVGRYDLDIKPVDLGQILDEIKAANTAEHVSIHIHQDAHNQLFNTYFKKFKTVIEELVKNAVIHNDKEAVEITITLHYPENNLAEILVSDNGSGISAQALDKVFDIFYTGKSKDRHNTVGAGLAISKKIIDFIGGSITLESSENSGTKFLIKWPASTN
ncbi:sensor histidine kinase [Adhaeribacter aquaticus]|uniref:sensor histidine kinase n=1 Tax=Adhaeribacter aquaticus TaxID=299567 RepID=UPI000418E480|nr:HAMP domain-containing sensor histidine kinase [Adhaeribacter aquaticus]